MQFGQEGGFVGHHMAILSVVQYSELIQNRMLDVFSHYVKPLQTTIPAAALP